MVQGYNGNKASGLPCISLNLVGLFVPTFFFFFFIGNKNFIKKSGKRSYTPGLYKTYNPTLHLNGTKI